MNFWGFHHCTSVGATSFTQKALHHEPCWDIKLLVDMKWIVDSYELLTIIRFAGECICPDDAEDNGQFFFGSPILWCLPNWPSFRKFISQIRLYTRYETHKKGSFYILGNLIRTGVFFPQFSDVAKVGIIYKPV